MLARLLIECWTRDWPGLAVIASATISHSGLMEAHVAGAAAVLCTRLEVSDAGGLGGVEVAARWREMAAAELVEENNWDD